MIEPLIAGADTEELKRAVEELRRMYEQERRARQSVEKEAENVQRTVDDAIDYRNQQRAVARDLLEQIKVKEKGDGAN